LDHCSHAVGRTFRSVVALGGFHHCGPEFREGKLANHGCLLTRTEKYPDFEESAR